MNYKYKKENYDFWKERLINNDPEKVCTNDTGLDRVESDQILSRLKNDSKILEIGCGNGILYNEICDQYNVKRYVGTDFVQELVDDCKLRIRDPKHSFIRSDMTEVCENTFKEKFDFIISKRAIQNVIDCDLQLKAIDDFGHHLEDQGTMILVESSQTALDSINLERKKYELEIINSPFHNLFFDDDKVNSHKFKNVELADVITFSSDFYFITRVIYARYAKEFLNDQPTYEHPLNKIAATMHLPQATSQYSQLKCYVFKKK